jgi:hypothetical protein
MAQISPMFALAPGVLLAMTMPQVVLAVRLDGTVSGFVSL